MDTRDVTWRGVVWCVCRSFSFLRMPLYCVPVPGLSPWAIPPHQAPQGGREGAPGVIAAAEGGGLPKRQREDATDGAGGEKEDAMDCTVGTKQTRPDHTKPTRQRDRILLQVGSMSALYDYPWAKSHRSPGYRGLTVLLPRECSKVKHAVSFVPREAVTYRACRSCVVDSYQCPCTHMYHIHDNSGVIPVATRHQAHPQKAPVSTGEYFSNSYHGPAFSMHMMLRPSLGGRKSPKFET